MLEILTPFNKIVRGNRSVDGATFAAVPGIWGYIASDGSIKNQVASTLRKINKLVITSATDNKYESNDVEVGRIATLEGPSGVRFRVDTAGYAGTPAVGDELVVSVEAASLGKLLAQGDTVVNGVYQIVAVCEQINSTEGWIICIHEATPRYVTLS